VARSQGEPRRFARLARGLRPYARSRADRRGPPAGRERVRRGPRRRRGCLRRGGACPGTAHRARPIHGGGHRGRARRAGRRRSCRRLLGPAPRSWPPTRRLLAGRGPTSCGCRSTRWEARFASRPNGGHCGPRSPIGTRAWGRVTSGLGGDRGVAVVTKVSSLGLAQASRRGSTVHKPCPALKGPNLCAL
jgi:hypothetical protein